MSGKSVFHDGFFYWLDGVTMYCARIKVVRVLYQALEKAWNKSLLQPLLNFSTLMTRQKPKGMTLRDKIYISVSFPTPLNCSLILLSISLEPCLLCPIPCLAGANIVRSRQNLTEGKQPVREDQSSQSRRQQTRGRQHR